MIPESRFIRSELIIRDLALPEEVLLARKSLIRWVALSLGMISPNESRRLLLDILEVLFEFHIKNQHPTTKDIIARLENVGGTGGDKESQKQKIKAVYYHLQRLMEMGVLSRKKGFYYLGDGEKQSLKDILKDIYLKKTQNAFANIGTAFDKLENTYK